MKKRTAIRHFLHALNVFKAIEAGETPPVDFSPPIRGVPDSFHFRSEHQGSRPAKHTNRLHSRAKAKRKARRSGR